MIVDGFVSWATRRPGIPDKVYSERNRGLGFIGHSIVGRERPDQDGIPDRFLSTAKDDAGRYTAYAAASCMFILRLSGELIQMYPVWVSTWTSGGREANTSYWAIEAEGGDVPYDEPLNAAQVATLLRLCDEFEAYTGRKVVRGSTFREHGEVAMQFGYDATACPSNRYRTFYAAMEAREKEDEMTDDERELLLLVAGLIAGPASGAEFRSVQEAKAALRPLESPGDKRVLMGLGALERRLGALEGRLEARSGIGGFEVPDHTHAAGGVER